jgi:hypothetical protein
VTRHIILISGKDSLAAAVVQLEKDPSLPYELVFNEVGWELPETLEWLAKVESYFGKPILRIGDDLTAICEEQNCLPTPWRRFCTKYAKIKPLNDYLGRTPAVLYFGLRADEPDRIGYTPPSWQTCVYPLREAGVDLLGVWRLCEGIGLLPPQFHWPWMEARVRFLLGDDQNLLDGLEPWHKSVLLAWRARNNCSLCFYKRLYEWIGLWEFHPAVFEDGCLLEEKLSHDPDFSWLSGCRLRDIPAKAEAAKTKRANQIVRFLRTRQQMALFDDGDMSDDLNVTSCGLFCGK